MIKTSILFALTLKDDFSGANIIGAGQLFHIDGKVVKPIKKPEGYYVFSGNKRECYELTIFSPKYLTTTIKINADTLSISEPVVTIRLHRNGEHYFPDCQWVTGKLEKGLMAIVSMEESIPLAFRSYENQQGSHLSLIRLQGFGGKNLSERRFAVGKGKSRELFYFGIRTTDGAYPLDHIPKKKPKESDPVCPIYSSPCNENGEYAVAVPIGADIKGIKAEGYDMEAARWVAC